MTPHPSDPHRWRTLPLVLSATFMALFDFFVVNVAAPSFRGDLHASDVALELIVGGYAFAYASGLITGGRLGDIFGYRRLFILGMAGFTVASALCGAAATPGQLVAARLAQGFAAAAMVPQVLALITAMFPPGERHTALGWFGATIGLGSVAGQVLGGLLLDANLFGLSWRTIFLVNVPIGVTVIALARRWLPPATATTRPRLDLVGAAGLSAGVGLILLPLVLGRSEGWPLWTVLTPVLALPVLAATVVWERRLPRRGGEPALDMELFGNRHFSAGIAVNVAVMAFFGSFMFAITLVLQSGMGLSPLAAGLTFGPLGAAFAITSMAARGGVARYGSRVVTTGAAFSGTGLAAMLLLVWLAPQDASAWSFAIPMTLVGLGNGLMVPSLIGVVLTGIDPRRAGSAAGALTTAQQFAGALGVAVLGELFFAVLGSQLGRGGFLHALTPVLAADIALVLVAAALSRLLPAAPTLRSRTGTTSPVATAGTG